MWKVAVALLVCALLGVAAYFFWQGKVARNRASLLSDCHAAVDRLEARWDDDPPESSADIINKTVEAGHRFCREYKFKEALRVLNTDLMICQLNNGCRPESQR